MERNRVRHGLTRVGLIIGVAVGAAGCTSPNRSPLNVEILHGSGLSAESCQILQRRTGETDSCPITGAEIRTPVGTVWIP